MKKLIAAVRCLTGTREHPCGCVEHWQGPFSGWGRHYDNGEPTPRCESHQAQHVAWCAEVDRQFAEDDFYSGPTAGDPRPGGNCGS